MFSTYVILDGKIFIEDTAVIVAVVYVHESNLAYRELWLCGDHERCSVVSMGSSGQVFGSVSDYRIGCC